MGRWATNSICSAPERTNHLSESTGVCTGLTKRLNPEVHLSTAWDHIFAAATGQFGALSLLHVRMGKLCRVIARDGSERGKNGRTDPVCHT